VQDFISDTNSPLFTLGDSYVLPDNACLTGVPSDLPLEEQTFTTPYDYQIYLEEAIQLIGLDPAVEGSDTYPNNPEDPGGTSSNVTPTGTPNEWVEEALENI